MCCCDCGCELCSCDLDCCDCSCDCDFKTIGGILVFIGIVALAIYGYTKISENPTQARIYAIAVSISLASLVILFCGWRWWSHKKKRQKAVEMYYAQKQAEEQARNQPQQGYYASPPPPPQIMDEAPPAYVEIRSDTNPQPSSTAY